MTSTLKIGWGKRSIAMDGPVPITGQFHLRVSFGAYTDVIVSALVLDNEQDSVIFVSADMVSVPPALLSAVPPSVHSPVTSARAQPSRA